MVEKKKKDNEEKKDEKPAKRTARNPVCSSLNIAGIPHPTWLEDKEKEDPVPVGQHFPQ
jgi:hypothetical protein